MKHEHQPLEGNAGIFGSRTQLAQVYPYRFCQGLARIILRHLKVKPLDNEVCLLEDIFERMTDDTPLTPQMRTAYRSGGQISWLQSRAQFHIGYQFSRCASRAASPTIADVRAINKTVRTIKSIPPSVRFWALRVKTRIVGFPDASIATQRAHVICLAEERDLRKGSFNSRGPLVDYETHKITATTTSTTVAELHGLLSSRSLVRHYGRDCRCPHSNRCQQCLQPPQKSINLSRKKQCVYSKRCGRKAIADRCTTLHMYQVKIASQIH